MFRPSKLYLGCVLFVSSDGLCVLSASHRGTSWELPSPVALLESPVARSTLDRLLVSASRFLLHPLAMGLIAGIDPDSPLQGSWQSVASERLKMGARARA